jgi:hypothetical protein
MKTIPLATFNEPEQARLFQERLARVEIPAVIHDESKLERFWFMSEPLAAVHVEVRRPDYLRARQLMSEWERAGDPSAGMVRCPECGSSRVEFPQISRKFLMPVAQAFFMALHLIPREYYCEDCHFTWPKERPVEPERDVLNFPIRSEIGMRDLHLPHSWRERLHRKRRA